MLKTIDTKAYGCINFLIGDDDLHLLDKFKFFVHKTETGFYLLSNDKKYLHRLIVNAPNDLEVHHINGNTLDNRRCNLQVLNHKEHTIETSKANSKLSENQIKEILLSNKSDKTIMQKYNITLAMLSNIRRRKVYAWCCPEIKRQEKKQKRHTKKILQQIKYHVLNGFNLKALSLIYDISLHNLYCMRKGSKYQTIEPAL